MCLSILGYCRKQGRATPMKQELQQRSISNIIIIFNLTHWGFNPFIRSWLTLISSQCGHHLWPVVVKSSGTLLFNTRCVNNVDSCRCSIACNGPHRSWQSAVYWNATRFIPELNRAGCLQSGAPLRGNCRKVFKHTENKRRKRRWLICIVGWLPPVWFQLLLRCNLSSEAPAAGEQYLLSLQLPPAETKPQLTFTLPGPLWLIPSF